MTPSHILAIFVAELRKVFSRGSGLTSLVLSVLLPLAVLAVFWEVLHAEGPMVNGQMLSSMVTASAVEATGWTLRVRNFFVLPLLLVLAISASIAGERADRTLRDALARPVSRTVVVLARVAAVATLAGVTLLVSGTIGFLGGLALFGQPAGTWMVMDQPSVVRLALGFAATFLSDLGLIALTAAVASFLESVAGVVVALVFLLIADFAWRSVLGLARLWFGMVDQGAAAAGAAESGTAQLVATLEAWTLGNALGAWEGWAETFEPARFAALVVVIGVATAVACVRHERMEVP